MFGLWPKKFRQPRSSRKEFPPLGQMDIEADKGRRRSFLRYLNWGLLFMGALAILATFAMPEYALYTISIAAVSLVTFVLVLLLLKYNHVRSAGILFSFLIEITFFLLLQEARSTPVQDPVNNTLMLVMMGLPIVFAGMTLGRQMVFWMALLNTLLQLLSIYTFGPQNIPTFSINVYWWVLAVAIWLYETTLERTMGLLRIIRINLEAIVDERTQSLSRTVADLEKSKAELELSNKDLEAFSYSVSHDLRAPLRSVIGYSDILAADYAGNLPEDGVDLISRIRQSAQKMNGLIDGLLAYSRTGQRVLSRFNIDLTELAQITFDELRQMSPGGSVMEFTLEKLPEANVDPTLFKQVFTNLLSNAIKYSSKRKAPHIEVGTFREDGETIVYVRDNGVGFDMRYADKLFGVFQRLHHEDEFEGTGVGLAIVQRIIRRHGGRVWAEAELGRGATFFFTLAPKQGD
jgi:signal transduction histidine kinase